MFGVRNAWDTMLEFKASPNELAKKRVIRGVLENFYADIEKPVVFDKSRGWLSLIEMTEYVLDKKIKIIVPVRDTRDVLASFEKLWRENAKKGQIEAEGQNYFQFQTTQGRTEFWLRKDQPVGLALSRIGDALQRGFADRLLFVEFESLTSAPEKTMKAVYDFLGEKWFPHNFNNVEQVTFEDDAVHGFKNLHTIRKKVEPMGPQWPHILGNFAEGLDSLNLWRC